MKKKLESGERMAIIETDIKYIKEQIIGLNNNLSIFIDKADNNYATKIELCKVENKIESHSNNSRSWIQSSIPWIFAAINFVFAIIVYFKR
jgi:hypothetical protein